MLFARNTQTGPRQRTAARKTTHREEHGDMTTHTRLRNSPPSLIRLRYIAFYAPGATEWKERKEIQVFFLKNPTRGLVLLLHPSVTSTSSITSFTTHLRLRGLLRATLHQKSSSIHPSSHPALSVYKCALVIWLLEKPFTAAKHTLQRSCTDNADIEYIFSRKQVRAWRAKTS